MAPAERSTQTETPKPKKPRPSRRPVVTAEELHESSLLRLPDVLRHVPVGRTRLYQLVADGKFPRPVQLTDRAVAWRWADVLDWLRSREETSSDVGGRAA